MAIALQARRLGDYISWEIEALMVAITAASWLLLFIRRDTQSDWQIPVVMAYVVIGLLPVKILAVRHNFPLTPERAEEHNLWLETQRRFSLRMIDVMRWFFLTILAGYALLHGWPAAQTMVWLRWLLIGVALAIYLFMSGSLIRGNRRLAAMGCNLRPVGSWSGPFGAAK